MILKNETQGNFVMVSQSILHDKSLKLFDRGLLITLMSLPDNWNFTVNGLVTILADGRDAVSGGIERLQEKGYLTKEQLRKNGKFSEICLRINVVPKKPLTEKPLTENPLSEKPIPCNPTQYKNKEYYKHKSKNKGSLKGGYKDESNEGSRNDGKGTDDKPWTKKEADLYGF